MRSLRVLITGGTGTFGYAMATKLLEYPVNRITILSRDEHKQDVMARHFNNNRLVFFVGDVRDKDRVRQAVQGHDIVIHAAAMKIVPKCEFDPFETIKTNVLGTQNVVEGCLAGKVWKCMLISTDKACNPYNLYGATKLAAERLMIAANNVSGTAANARIGNLTRESRKSIFSVVRYGNVTGSRGSVLPIWEEQFKKKEPISITHKDMHRFWLEPTEAVNFVDKCLHIMGGGEIFVPRMPTFNIMQLLSAFERVKGTPIEHVDMGLRPGEKLYEDIITDHECRSGYRFDSDTFVITPLGSENHGLGPYDSRAEYDRILDIELEMKLRSFIECPQD